MTILSSKDVKANKKHVCCYCLKTIDKGEIYNKSSIVNDRIYTWKSHLSCLKIAAEMLTHPFYDYPDGITSEDFLNYITEKIK